MNRCTTAVLLPVVAAAAATLSVLAQDPARADGQGLQALRAAGSGAEIAIYPVLVVGRPDRDGGDALGLLLERRGLRALQRSAREFAPAAGADWSATPTAFAEHVRLTQNPPAHALYAEFLGTPESGPQEVRFAIADAFGRVEVVERHTQSDAGFRRAFSRGGDPMACCGFVVDRLAEVLALPVAKSEDGEGTFAVLWRTKSGLPEPAELQAMEPRRAALRERHAEATWMILPTRIDGAVAADSAVGLAALLENRLSLHATAGTAALDQKVQRSSNEQKMLWEFARALREQVRRQPVDADYVLMADYTLDPTRGEAGTVHFAVCDRAGELVLVDYQNSHHADFQKIHPKTSADCDRLLVHRLIGYLH